MEPEPPYGVNPGMTRLSILALSVAYAAAVASLFAEPVVPEFRAALPQVVAAVEEPAPYRCPAGPTVPAFLWSGCQ